jgi:1-acyl-sn-glycerol-3-phosphate acyltransferase
VKWLIRLRVGLRLALIAPFTAVLFMVRMFALVLAPVFPGLEMRVRRACFRAWGKGILGIVGVRVKVTGQPPSPPFFMVTNHLTNLDVVLLSSVLGCVFVSRADIANWPVIGLIVRHMGTIFVDRSNIRDTKRVNAQIAEAMAKGHGVHMFAESRVSQDAQVHPFKAPLLEPAVQMNLPVYHGALSYCAPEGWPSAADAIIWKEGVSFKQNVCQILGMPHVYATLTFGETPISGRDRKELAEELYRAVSQEFTPVDTLPETPES